MKNGGGCSSAFEGERVDVQYLKGGTDWGAKLELDSSAYNVASSMELVSSVPVLKEI